MRILPPRLSWLWLIIIASLTAACADKRGGSIPYAPGEISAPDRPAAPFSSEDYIVSTGDVLTIDVFQAEKLSKDYVVDPSGNISVPLIGQVSAIGKSIPELRRNIAGRLAENYMNNPDVSIAVKESTNRLLTVEGSVRQPGMFPVTERLTLIQAVALARGTDERANPRRVGIFRTVDGKRMAAAFDLTSIRRGEALDPQVYAGDIIVVDGAGKPSVFTTIMQTLPVFALFRPY